MRKLIHKLYKLLQFLVLALERPQQFFAILKMMVANRAYLNELLRLHNADWLRQADINTVIDVGAYTGSFAFAARSILPQAQIYSFEPLPDNFARLAQQFDGDGKFKGFNIALGSQRGETSFYRNEFAPSSSVLPMSREHQAAFPHTTEVTKITVPLKRLDDLKPKLDLQSKVLMKIDVQGYDFEVLKGAQELLAQVDYVIVEIGVQLLYEEQATFEEIYDYLCSLGFVYAGDFDQLVSPKDGKVLQIDALFRREA
ncbi:MAG: FkbM family methyltransferase [Anaerolineales bacterium]|nr:FkbM family methyltransferase [Anaerolineales bacterium]